MGDRKTYRVTLTYKKTNSNKVYETTSGDFGSGSRQEAEAFFSQHFKRSTSGIDKVLGVHAEEISPAQPKAVVGHGADAVVGEIEVKKEEAPKVQLVKQEVKAREEKTRATKKHK